MKYIGGEFSSEQLQWLAFIKEHLIQNLTLDKQAFNLIPILEIHGGLARARKVFGSSLDDLITEITLKITA